MTPKNEGTSGMIVLVHTCLADGVCEVMLSGGNLTRIKYAGKNSNCYLLVGPRLDTVLAAVMLSVL